MNGIILIDKEQGYTSRDVVNIVGKKLKTNKIGHTGTLDPLATGVLVLCIGKATKLVELLTNEDKIYEAEITLGVLTDTLDITGNVLKEQDCIISKESIEKTLNDFTTTYEQEVPYYSAIKVKGKKLYEYARSNEEVILPKRKVIIYSLELINIKYQNQKTIIDVRCHVSKGTYIRSLARDIATSLNTFGIISQLKRIKHGNFHLNDCYQLKDIDNNNYKLISIEEVLKDYPVVIADEELAFKIRNGQKLENKYNHDTILFKNENNNLLALYKKSDSMLIHWKTL